MFLNTGTISGSSQGSSQISGTQESTLQWKNDLAEPSTPKSFRRARSVSPIPRVCRGLGVTNVAGSPDANSELPVTNIAESPELASGPSHTSTSVPRQGHDVEGSDVEHPTFSGSSNLNEYDRRILFNTQPGSRQSWRRNNLSQSEPMVSDDSTSLLRNLNCLENFQMWLKCPAENCGQQATLTIVGPESQSHLKVKCTACKNEFIDRPPRSELHTGPHLYDLRSVYESLVHNISHDAYRSIMESYGQKGTSRTSFNQMKHFVYTDYKKFFDELKTDTIDQIKRFYVRNGVKPNDGKIDIIISMDGSYPKRTSRIMTQFIA